jgi:hypothetical protein
MQETIGNSLAELALQHNKLHIAVTMTLRSLTIRGLPEPLLKGLRAAAKRNRRSLNAEVLVRLEAGATAAGAELAVLADRETSPGREASAAARVREPDAPPYEVRRAFEEADRSRLRSDLALTPEQRVHLAEELARTAASAGPRPRFQRVIQFDRYDDYLDWKRHAERGS